jgi:DNA polymerase
MHIGILADETDFDGWRKAARAFRLAGVPPERAAFRIGAGGDGLFDEAVPAARPDASPFGVPKAFVDMGRDVVLHRSADRFDLLYRLLWRLAEEPDLMKVVTDTDVADAMERVKNVGRASHKMKAFVRFRQLMGEDGDRWVAWFEPAHRVLEKTAPFFARRFTSMHWTILTPDGSASWDGEALSFGPPATRDQAPSEDEIEESWKTYYASTFNPARLRTKAMQGEMPKRYWKNLPEAALIPGLVARAAVRTEAMVAAPAPEPNARLAKTLSRINRDHSFDEGFVPSTLNELKQAVHACRRCPLWRDATQGVCGEGPRQARLMIVGEQPGDHEDLTGRPFVGPAGEVLDAALEQAGIDRGDVFITNAVKHFKHEPRGKRRLHRTPLASEVSACRWWLDAERRLVKPDVVVTLGGTAASAVLGRQATVTKERGRGPDLADGARTVLTVHPSYLLRIPVAAARSAERDRFVLGLKQAKALL